MALLAPAFAAPYQHLLERNTELVVQFWMSPDTMNEIRSAADGVSREMLAAWLRIVQSPSFNVLSRELFDSHGKFVAELTQASVESAVALQQRSLEHVTAASERVRRGTV
jgi:hypothetical protein